ncbi:Clostripain family protein [uncultured archaeon]|nr:Clostripain family protein [uncultured archaeon]
MKQNYFGIKIGCFILIVVLLCSVGQGTAIAKESSLTNQASDWVIMVYLNGDNNLSAAQGTILENIRQAGSSTQVKIVLFIDQNQAGDTRLYYLDGTTLTQQTWPTESSMDDPATIVSLVTKVKNDLPANHYALFISSNKGSGWQGLCWDDHGRGQMITMPEFLNALNQITNNGANKLDILGIETCMTGNIEVAYQINSCVNFFIAYPECAMAGEWPYVQSFNDLKNTTAMSPKEFAIDIANHFVPHKYKPQRIITTMAATNCSYLPSLASHIDELGVFFINHLDLYKNQITTALESARIYARLWYIDYYIDFYNFLDLCNISDPEFITIKNAIENTMNAAVIANTHISDDPAHGLSIYFPRRAGDYNDSLRYTTLPSPYEATNFAITTHWDEFLKTYLGIANNTAPAKPTFTGSGNGKVGVMYDCTISTTDAENHQVYYFIDWGDGNTTGWLGPYDSGEQITVNHTWKTKETFTVKAKAKDVLNAESEWATLAIKIPITPGKSRIILIGKITSVEINKPMGFRFLPINVIEIDHIEGENKSAKILNETYGEYPCCGYLPFSEFKGIVTKKFLAGVWVV